MTAPAQPLVPSYTSGISDIPLLGDTIGDNLDRTAGARPDAEALVDRTRGERYTWAEFVAEVDALALGLLELGVAVGDRVGIWAPNCSPWTLLQYATAKIGAILVNINPAYRTHELAFVLDQAGVSLLVAARSFKSSDYAAMIEEVRGDRPALQRVVIIDSDEWTGLFDRSGDVARVRAVQAELTPDDPINIQYTSGTTGFPKGATLSHHNILNNGFFVGQLIGYSDADRVCIPVPFYHCFGMVMGNLACTSSGATMVIPAPGFDPTLTLEAVAQERCTSLYGVPTMFIAELGLEDFESYDLTSLRTGIMAGSPCPIEVMKQVVERMGMSEVAISYGMTETSPVSTQTRTDDSLDRRVSTVGRTMPHLESKIVDPETGRTVPRGEPGRAVHPRVLGDARLLGAARQDRRGDRPRPLDAHRRPRRHGRRGLHQHHRPDQGHGHPGRGEHLPARDRGVPLHPPRHRRRAGHRGARRALRRGDHGVGAPEAGHRARSPPSRSGSSPRAASPTTRSRATSASSTSSR